ncbi:DUF551 domain-containing protein [Escherichia coli]|uniref:DUF551 domain-containing protein n=1 Tax=Escherichia coli TaxID=562 RepID=UPI0004D93E65|nr:DUF551 domain-containing protein [Escherichia coli]KDW03529.1 hypothetical protein AB60_2345 [Escherichia coli 2-156-04_S1_C3]
MMELTKERIEQFIKSPIDNGLTRSEQMSMARQLLAVMEQEPVGEVVLGDYDDCGDYPDAKVVCIAAQGQADWNNFRNETKLYAATQLPQPAVVVSEAQSKKLFDEWSCGDGALGELRASGVPDEFISMLKEFSLATWEACREAMLKHSAPFIVTSDHRMMEMPAIHDIDAVSAMLQGADASITHEGKNHHKDKLAMVDHSGDSNNMVEPVTTTYKLPFEQWLSKQTGTIDVECGCVMTEVFYHWLRVAYEAGNSPVTPDGWISCSERMPSEEDVLVYCSDTKEQMVGFHKGKGLFQFFYMNGVEGVCEPSHWMPLPEPPQEMK